MGLLVYEYYLEREEWRESRRRRFKFRREGRQKKRVWEVERRQSQRFETDFHLWPDASGASLANAQATEQLPGVIYLFLFLCIYFIIIIIIIILLGTPTLQSRFYL